ncbi:putative alpha-amylase 2B [Apostichopus japonicus]|uniref:alpha-amylase n=1 Tax=Stichopus japonicus TaxID=307972 RepID=A0A2G8JVX7_STIJA|nr:putative alpha-amylase 2B [Apostichopus japonicus]
MLEPRRVLVQLFEWKWTDVALECERFLGPKGYGGVQVSPPNEHAMIVDDAVTRPWWERYQPVSYNLESRSGTEDQFRDMIQRCNSADVRIYVDVVINHMAIKGDEERGTAGSFHHPKSFSFPAVPYSRQNFNTGKVLEQAIIIGVAGFRVDAAKHMWPDDLDVIYDQLNNLNSKYFQTGARPFIYQEVIDHGGECISATEYTPLGQVTEFKYGNKIADGIRGINHLRWFKTFGETWNMLPSNHALVFIDNHDSQRERDTNNIITYEEPRFYKIASAFMLAHPYGTTRVMSSFKYQGNRDVGPPSTGSDNVTLSPIFDVEGLCDHDNGWVCEHRWREIRNMVGFRNAVGDTPLKNWWDNGFNQIAFGRGNKGFLVINNEDTLLCETLQTGLPVGDYCDIISGDIRDGHCTGVVINVNKVGYATFVIEPDETPMVAIHIHSKAKREKKYNYQIGFFAELLDVKQQVSSLSMMSIHELGLYK